MVLSDCPKAGKWQMGQKKRGKVTIHNPPAAFGLGKAEQAGQHSWWIHKWAMRIRRTHRESTEFTGNPQNFTQSWPLISVGSENLQFEAPKIKVPKICTVWHMRMGQPRDWGISGVLRIFGVCCAVCLCSGLAQAAAHRGALRPFQRSGWALCRFCQPTDTFLHVHTPLNPATSSSNHSICNSIDSAWKWATCPAQNPHGPIFPLVIGRKWEPPFRNRLVLEEGNANSETCEKPFPWSPSKPQQLQRVISSLWCHCTFIQLDLSLFSLTDVCPCWGSSCVCPTWTQPHGEFGEDPAPGKVSPREGWPPCPPLAPHVCPLLLEPRALRNSDFLC